MKIRAFFLLLLLSFPVLSFAPDWRQIVKSKDQQVIGYVDYSSLHLEQNGWIAAWVKISAVNPNDPIAYAIIHESINCSQKQIIKMVGAVL